MRKLSKIPKFKNESAEADWWTSAEGREFVKQKSAERPQSGPIGSGSTLVNRLKKPTSIQIALRLPEADLEQARQIATKKGIGYQTLLKMLVHEGLRREAKRA
jgi:predicted DNA binding CopG/RHH family protein